MLDGAQQRLGYNGDDAQFEYVSHSALPNYQLRLKSPKLCDPSVKQYSGYLDVSEERHLFFWFFEARNNPQTAPVVIWLNGGPGCSSTTGLFFALGPCVIGEDGKNTTVNEWSWNTNANMLFIEQPAGVGYSYNTGPTVDNSFVAADDMWVFLQLFYKRFGGYSRELHVAGESYGGTYVPHIARAVWEKNKQVKKNKELEKVELASILIGNGLTDPYFQFGVMHEWLCNGKWKVWDKDSKQCRKLSRDVKTCQRLVKSCEDFDTDLVCGTAASFCFKNEIAIVSYSGLNPYDARLPCEPSDDSTGCYPSTEWIVSYLNREDIKKELGASPNVLFNTCDPAVQNSFIKSGDGARSSAVLLPEMIEDGVRMLIYVGDADLLCPGSGQILWLENLNTTFQETFKTSPRTDFRTHNRTAGFVRTTGGKDDAGRITYVEIFDAGHMAPHDQPDAALDMFNRWIWNKPLAGGKH